MLNSKTQASPLALVGLQSKKPIGERALGLVAAYMPARTESCSFDEARSPMGLRVRFVGTTTGYQSVDACSISNNKKTCQVIINVVLSREKVLLAGFANERVDFKEPTLAKSGLNRSRLHQDRSRLLFRQDYFELIPSRSNN